jgi:hypothetical protein
MQASLLARKFKRRVYIENPLVVAKGLARITIGFLIWQKSIRQMSYSRPCQSDLLNTADYEVYSTVLKSSIEMPESC